MSWLAVLSLAAQGKDAWERLLDQVTTVITASVPALVAYFAFRKAAVTADKDDAGEAEAVLPVAPVDPMVSALKDCRIQLEQIRDQLRQERDRGNADREKLIAATAELKAAKRRSHKLEIRTTDMAVWMRVASEIANKNGVPLVLPPYVEESLDAD